MPETAVDVVAVQAHDQLPILEGGCGPFAFEDYAGWHGVMYDPSQYLEPGQTAWYFNTIDDNVGTYSAYVDDGWLTYDYNPETHLYDLPVWNPWWHTVYTYLQCSE